MSGKSKEQRLVENLEYGGICRVDFYDNGEICWCTVIGGIKGRETGPTLGVWYGRDLAHAVNRVLRYRGRPDREMSNDEFNQQRTGYGYRQ